MREVIETQTGAVSGTAANGIACFLGNPYAAVPVGVRRFAGPRPHAPWASVHDAIMPGPNARPRVQDGSAFARDSVILVAINYRIGTEGFLPIPGIPTNLGLRGQIFALLWVRENIAAFGGDPANVTLFGESAEAMSVASLMASPLAKGLFRRAIIESGHGGMTRDIGVAQRLLKKFAKRLKITPDEAGYRFIEAGDMLAAREAVSNPTA